MVCDWLRKVSYLTMIGWKMALLFGTMHESKTCRAFISLSHGRNLNHIFLMFNSCFVLKACPAISDFLLLAKHWTIVSAHKEQTCQVGVETVSLVVSIKFVKKGCYGGGFSVSVWFLRIAIYRLVTGKTTRFFYKQHFYKKHQTEIG